jgi:hypothetical protein
LGFLAFLLGLCGRSNDRLSRRHAESRHRALVDLFGEPNLRFSGQIFGVALGDLSEMRTPVEEVGRGRGWPGGAG